MIYNYKCPQGHYAEKWRKMAARHDPLTCDCGEPMNLIISLTHCPPDGVYSYAPNSGDPRVFERRWENLKAGKRLNGEE